MQKRIDEKIQTVNTVQRDSEGMCPGRVKRCGAYVFALIICLALCGCTRREQLVLETDGAAGTQTAAPDDAQDVPPDAGDAFPAAGQEEPQGQTAQTTAGGAAPEEAAQTICVHVCGAVKKPDVYKLPAGSRVYEAVGAAGGFAEDADDSYVNQAQILTDGAKLVIPTLAQTQAAASLEEQGTPLGIVDAPVPAYAGEPGGGGSAPDDGRININTASEAELCNIPGIGATRAAAIVAYRQEKGSFAAVEDIMNVSGIKEGTYAKIKDSIKVN